MLTILQLCLLLGCSASTVDSAAKPQERPPDQEEIIEPEPWSYKPDMVLFHNVAVVTQGDQISCFDDGDDSPYCGVHKIIMTVWEDYSGLSDENNCQVVHRVSPDLQIEMDSESADNFITLGAMASWEFDATQSLVMTSPMCDLIAEDSDLAGVVEMFKAENVAFGYKHLSQEMHDEYRENYGDSYTEEEWQTDVQPFLLGMANRIGGVYRTPNVGVAYQIGEENQLLSDEDGYQMTVPMDGVGTLPDGYYRAPPYYVYDITRFIPETE